jgi:ferric-dicitrate binding protein FerR (iron transport regulator)
MSREHTDVAVSEAVHWFHRFRSSGTSAPTPEELSEWATWSADDDNLTEFCRVDELWQRLGLMSKSRRPIKTVAAADGSDPSISFLCDWLARGDARRRLR